MLMGQLGLVVDEYMNCEDIAFSFMVANATNSAGIFVHAKVKNVDSDNAISAKRGHGTERCAFRLLHLAFAQLLLLCFQGFVYLFFQAGIQ